MKSILILSVVLLFSACDSVGKPSCKTQESCQTDPNCQCWCSVKCGFRKKKADDHPVYVENDPNGKFCYCKQWDADHYEENCVEGKKVEEPAGSQ